MKTPTELMATYRDLLTRICKLEENRAYTALLCVGAPEDGELSANHARLTGEVEALRAKAKVAYDEMVYFGLEML